MTRTLALVCLAVAILWGHPAHAECGSRLGPQERRDALLARPEGVHVFVVRGLPDQIARAMAMHQSNPDLPAAIALPFIDAAAVAVTVADALSLCDERQTQQVWHLHSALADTYVKVLQGIQYAVRTVAPPGVINLSLGPPIDALPQRGDAQEPMHAATRRAADLGLLPLFAIGNRPEIGASPGPNPWCLPDWVVCVGAASADAKTLWERSVEGDPATPGSWPDVVAAGVDIMAPWPSDLPKSDARRLRDESDPRFLELPAPKRHLFTIMSGTSQATAQVSRAAAQITHFLRSLAEQRKVAPGELMFSLEMPIERWAVTKRPGARLAGEAVGRSNAGVEVAYRLVEWWRLVKQLLVDTALPMPGYVNRPGL